MVLYISKTAYCQDFSTKQTLFRDSMVKNIICLQF